MHATESVAIDICRSLSSSSGSANKNVILCKGYKNNLTHAHQWLRQISMKLLFLTPLFYWLKLVLLLLISLKANKKGGQKKLFHGDLT